MDIDQEKRMAGDYEIIHALHIGDREIVLGENPSAPEDERYVCAFCQQHEIFANYTEVMVSDDYPELVKLFGERVAEQAEKTHITLNGPKIQGIPNSAITAEDCEQVSYQEDIRGKSRGDPPGGAAPGIPPRHLPAPVVYQRLRRIPQQPRHCLLLHRAVFRAEGAV